jgi:hypothetical protein
MLDAGDTPDVGGVCASNTDCDDGAFCNGGERCTPGDEAADGRGCVRGAPPCPETSCDEVADDCGSTCADADGDGAASVTCGGTDCDDDDPDVNPDVSEVCDAGDVDEDCDPTTVGDDGDGDGYVSDRCCNPRGADLFCGLDCDDLAVSVNPGAVDPCGGGDQDCDGSIDENPDQTFYRDVDGDGFGVVADTLVACSAPSGYAVLPGDCNDTLARINPGNADVCNLDDDDCDGSTDEGCGCAPSGRVESCGPDLEMLCGPSAGTLCGICRRGTRTCVTDAWSGCVGAVDPSVEVCDGALDEDCDTRVDEGCICTNGTTRVCGTATGDCESIVQTCANGNWPRDCADEAGVVWPEAEACEGTRDEDCDGATDESCACIDGSIDMLGCGTDEGECTRGSRTCSGGTWGACSGGVSPATEICEGARDEDCDAAIDEGCACINGQTDQTACGTELGECTRGTRSCASGAWGSCSGGVGPTTEICEGTRDEDCDGGTDEGCACVNGTVDRTACGTDVGDCVSGMRTCVSGAWGACSGGMGPGGEICEGSRDEDCDGATDEGCTCTNGTMQSCGIGACAGMRTCAGGVWGACSGASPSTELCNGIDDDCDGIDDPSDSVQLVGSSCGTSVGLCTVGTYSCPGSALACSGVQPTAEVCNHRDDDCDTLLDDGAGVATCSLNRTNTSTPTLPSSSTCSWGACGSVIRFASDGANEPARIAALRAPGGGAAFVDWGQSQSVTATVQMNYRTSASSDWSLARVGVLVSPVMVPASEASFNDPFPTLTGSQRAYAAIFSTVASIALLEIWEITASGRTRRTFTTTPSACAVNTTTSNTDYQITLSNDAGVLTASLTSNKAGCTGTTTVSHTVSDWQSAVYGDSETVGYPTYMIGAYGDNDGGTNAALTRMVVTRTNTSSRGHCIACPW